MSISNSDDHEIRVTPIKDVLDEMFKYYAP
jgi:hypothetical protein